MKDTENIRTYFVGGGIASLAGAVYLIQDGHISGKNIFIFEESGKLGGSMDGSGTPKTGYQARGGRMFSDEVYDCTFDLFSRIPLKEGSPETLLDDFKAFNKEAMIHAKARLVENGKILDTSSFGLGVNDDLSFIKIMALPESYLGDSKISDHFSRSFFETTFWHLFCTTFAFEPWHSTVEFKRYVLRFIQEFPRMDSMIGVRNTRYNQYDSVILPVTNWLKNQGVNFLMESRVTSLKFTKDGSKERVEKIIYSQGGERKEISTDKNDLVFLTNGSMTTNSAFGTTKSAPETITSAPQDSWALWKDISEKRVHFGNPSAFAGNINESKWESFSATFKNRVFSDLMEKFSGNRPGTGGITTFANSNWLLSIVTPPHPHFQNQPDDINILWGYGLYPDKKGNYVQKKMSECSGEEIMTEVCSHLGFVKELSDILRSMDCVPCMMPYITSQFMPRKLGDRPLVIPEHTENFAFLGQFCEIPDEIVFTVEYSVRSAMIAVYDLLGIKKEIPPIYQGLLDQKTIRDLFKTVLNIDLIKLVQK